MTLDECCQNDDLFQGLTTLMAYCIFPRDDRDELWEHIDAGNYTLIIEGYYATYTVNGIVVMRASREDLLAVPPMPARESVTA